MKKKRYFGSYRYLFLLFLIAVCFLFIKPETAHAKVTYKKAIAHSKKTYYLMHNNIKNNRCDVDGSKGDYISYWTKNGGPSMSIVYWRNRGDGAATLDMVKKHTAEYYYDKNYKPVFVFAYRKTGGKVKEYRAYFGKNGKLYRYIGSNGKVKNFKKGLNIYSPQYPEMAKKMYRGSLGNLHYYGIIK